PLIRAPHFDIPKPRWGCSVPCAHHLLRLSLPTVRRSPQRPLFARANRIHGIPELGRNPRVRRVLEHPRDLSVLDLPADLAAELEVVTLIVDRPALIGLH